MLLRSTVFILIAWVVILQADKAPKYLTCDETPFCKDLRQKQPGEDEKLTIGDFPTKADDQGNVYVPVNTVKDNKKRGNLQIQLLKNNLVRVKLNTNEQRFEIPEGIVLEKTNQEVISDVTLQQDDDKKVLTISPTADDKPKVTLSKTDSKLTFHYDSRPLVVLDISQVIFKQNQDYFAFNVIFNGANYLYGLHHHAHNLELKDTVATEPFRLRNTDRVNFKADSTDSLYGSVPVLYGYSSTLPTTSGIFLHNAAEQWVDIRYEGVDNPTAQFIVERGTLDLFVLLGPQIEDVVKQFTYLTGKAHMPQLWTLGYHQCRWSYDTQLKVLDVMDKMAQNNFPMDAIWLDIDYTDGYKYFTWNTAQFNDLDTMFEKLAKNNKKLVTIIDPHIKVDENYELYKTAAKEKYFVQNADNTDFKGISWPGQSSWIDFLNEDARTYYASFYNTEQFHKNHQETLAGIWNDMNEPSVENREQYEMSMPYDVKHKYKKGKGQFDTVNHGDIHNIYGLLHTMSTHEGLLVKDKIDDDTKKARRPFILTRSHFAGSQRYAAMWTGDNTPDWAHLKNSYSECMLSNLVGHVFCGADIPGFFELPKPTAQFVYRAYQAGIWLPFFRGHATKTAEDREPYVYNKKTQDLIRSAIRMRYRHIPTWYQLFYEHSQTGAPVIRPLFYNFPEEVGFNDHIMLGNNILARPVFEEDAKEVVVRLPGKDEHWYRIDDKSFKPYEGDQNLTINVVDGESPVFYRGGSIIVTRDRDVMSTAEGDKLPLTVYVNLDKEFTATGKLYHDDGVSFAYEKAYFLYAQLSFSEENMLQIEPIGTQNHKGLEVVVEKVIVNDWSLSDADVSTDHSTDEVGNSLSSVNVIQALRNDGNKLLYKLRR